MPGFDGGVVDSAGFVSALGVVEIAALGFKVVTVRFFAGVGISPDSGVEDVSPSLVDEALSVDTIWAST